MWVDEYIQIPFKCDGRDRTGLDCYGLVCLVYKEQLGITLPDYAGIFVDQSMKTLLKVAEVMEEGLKTWDEVTDRPKPFDMIVLRTGRHQWHVGLVVDRLNMIHIMSGVESCVEEFKGLYWKHRVTGFRRWSGANIHR